ncbi:hypothetical protein CEXT_132391 [Caerostris extrusa]|uniref:Calponin-homology (CH) domain-containing protein n=1 Tax=Caerostris extrusa TaxID=172846 RepID=A0AAV4UA89_CAEEX|nr:hypothetical protein CEXT_132391 [Caerostris extrusa]
MTDTEADVKHHLYIWLKSFPFLQKKNLRRDFSDARLVAKLINYFMPKFALENAYPSCMSVAKKIDNWTRLNSKVLSQLGCQLSKENIEDLANSKADATEEFLLQLASSLYKTNKHQIKITIRQASNVALATN